MRDVVTAGPGPKRSSGGRGVSALPPVSPPASLRASVAPLAVALIVVACGGDGGPTEPADPAPEPPPETATGALEVSTATAGPEPDPDGYTVTVDDGDGRAIGTDDTLVVEDLGEGEHAVELSNLASNCGILESGNPRTVPVSAGDTASAHFAVSCEGRAALEVATSTVAPGLDGDGFRVAVDGGSARSIGTDDTEIFDNLASGDHTVELSGLATGCSVDGDNPRDVTLAADDTGTAAFAVTCGLRDHVVFASGRDRDIGEPDIYALPADGSSPALRVTENGGIAPAVSPDGSHVAFTSRRAGPGLDIFVRVVDGSGPAVQLTEHQFMEEQATSPVWSPDGTRIAFASARDGDGRQIYVMPADGSGTPERLTEEGGRDPAWSPDGTRIAFESNRGGDGHEVYVMPADGSGTPEQVTDGGGEDPTWSPEGSRIAFTSDRDGDEEIYKVCVDVAVAPEPLTGDGADDFYPAWSPDGGSIAFVSDRDGNPEVYVMGSDGSDPRNLSRDADTDLQPAWSPGTSSGFGPRPGPPEECQEVSP